jgi:hypothetical protein
MYEVRQSILSKYANHVPVCSGNLSAISRYLKRPIVITRRVQRYRILPLIVNTYLDH